MVSASMSPIAALELSPVILLSVLCALARMLYGPAAQLAAGYICPLQIIV